MYLIFTQELFYPFNLISIQQILTERMVHFKFVMSNTKRSIIHIKQLIFLANFGTVHSINWLDWLIQVSGIFSILELDECGNQSNRNTRKRTELHKKKIINEACIQHENKIITNIQ